MLKFSSQQNVLNFFSQENILNFSSQKRVPSLTLKILMINLYRKDKRDYSSVKQYYILIQLRRFGNKCQKKNEFNLCKKLQN